MAEAPIKAAFEELGIEWKLKEHAVAATVEEGLVAIGEWASECRYSAHRTLRAHARGCGLVAHPVCCARSFAKNLFFSDKKLGNFLFTVTATRKVCRHHRDYGALRSPPSPRGGVPPSPPRRPAICATRHPPPTFDALASRQVDPKKISGFVGLSSQGNFRFASAEKLMEMLGVVQARRGAEPSCAVCGLLGGATCGASPASRRRAAWACAGARP